VEQRQGGKVCSNIASFQGSSPNRQAKGHNPIWGTTAAEEARTSPAKAWKRVWYMPPCPQKVSSTKSITESPYALSLRCDDAITLNKRPGVMIIIKIIKLNHRQPMARCEPLDGRYNMDSC